MEETGNDIKPCNDDRSEEKYRRYYEERFRSIVEASPTGMHLYHLRSDGIMYLTGANPAADKILGIPHAPLVGKTINEAFPNLEFTGIPELYRKVATGETSIQTFEIPYEDKRFSGYYVVQVFRIAPENIVAAFTDITTRRQTEEALRRSEIEYRDTLDSLPDCIYVVDRHNRIVMVNAVLKKEMGDCGVGPDCVGQVLVPGMPFISEMTMKSIHEVFDTGMQSVSESKLNHQGRTIFAEISKVPIFKDGITEKVVVMIRDRSKEKEVEELMRRSSAQKEVLLREIHHRVKNNLAIVISLLNFQLRNNATAEFRGLILDVQMRIRSMAMIHENLYRSENLDRIPLATYIESLAYMILNAFSGHRISLIRKLEPVDVSIETALPIGLIINELITNACKYAFPDGMPGELTIALSHGPGDHCLLVVEDNGIGLPVTTNMDTEKSIGLYIVRLLVDQIEGSVTVTRNQGTTFTFAFRNIIRKEFPEKGN